MIFNGVDIEQYFRVGKIKRRFLPSLAVNEISIPNRRGSLYGGRKINPMVIEVELFTLEETKGDLRKTIREAAGVLMAPGQVPIEFNDEPGFICYGSINGDSDLNEIGSVGEASITILVMDGVKYGAEQLEIVTEKKVSVDGTAETFPSIKVRFDKNQTGYQISNGDQTLILRHGFQQHETLEINFATRGITLNGELYLQAWDFRSRYWFLQPGENDIKATAETEIKWLPAYY